MIYLAIEKYAGLGNQFFQYAHAYALAKKYNQKITIVSYLGYADSRREYFLNLFNLDRKIVKKVIRVDSWNIFKGMKFKNADRPNRVTRRYIERYFQTKIKSGKAIERKVGMDFSREYIPDEVMYQDKNYYVDGFYESYKYFNDYAAEIRNQFKVKEIPNDECVRETLTNINQDCSVAVHIRMGDFVECNRFFSLDYYIKAIEYVRKQLNNPTFFILSQDDEVIKHFTNYSDNVKIINFNCKNKDIMEWYALSQCKHHIITNSTYSWWAAYISDYSGKRVFVPDSDLYLEKENAATYKSESVRYGLSHYHNYFLPEYEVIPFK